MIPLFLTVIKCLKTLNATIQLELDKMSIKFQSISQKQTLLFLDRQRKNKTMIQQFC